MEKEYVYQAEQNGKYYWFVANSKKRIMSLYGFLKINNIFQRKDVKPDDFFIYIFKDEEGNIKECRWDERIIN